jgi:hypothetical protein
MTIAQWCGVLPSDPAPIIYHGAHSTDAKMLMQAGQNSFCLSYHNIQASETYKHPAMEKPNRAFLDSGAFTFLVQGQKNKTSRKELDAQCEKYCAHYVKWLKKFGSIFDFYVTFDYVVEAPLVHKMTQHLRNLGVQPTPVYHGDSSLDWLKKYIDSGYKLICLSKRNFLGDRTGLYRYYDQAFNIGEKAGIKFHSFASGLGPEVWNYPWYSVDSTSIPKVSGFGSILLYSPTRGISVISISREGTLMSGTIAEIIKHRGFDLQKLREDRTTRVLFNAQTITEIQKHRKAKVWQSKTLF